MRGFPIKAGTIIEFIGAEVTWEIVKTDAGWFVWASHTGEHDDYFVFKGMSKSLDRAVAQVGKKLWRHGPDWIKTYDKSGRARKVRV